MNAESAEETWSAFRRVCGDHNLSEVLPARVAEHYRFDIDAYGSFGNFFIAVSTERARLKFDYRSPQLVRASRYHQQRQLMFEICILAGQLLSHHLANRVALNLTPENEARAFARESYPILCTLI